jgi:hypothetical protein
MVHADLLKQGGHAVDFVGTDLALIGAAQRAGNRTAHLQAGGLGARDHGGEPRDALFDAAVQVALAEGLGGRSKHHHLVGPGRQRGFQSLGVGHQHTVAHTGLSMDAGHDFCVVGHLRHPLGTHETGDFNFAQPRGLQAVYELNLVGRGHGLLLVLQAVARANVHQGDVAGQGTHGANSCSGGIVLQCGHPCTALQTRLRQGFIPQ